MGCCAVPWSQSRKGLVRCGQDWLQVDIVKLQGWTPRVASMQHQPTLKWMANCSARSEGSTWENQFNSCLKKWGKKYRYRISTKKNNRERFTRLSVIVLQNVTENSWDFHFLICTEQVLWGGGGWYDPLCSCKVFIAPLSLCHSHS